MERHTPQKEAIERCLALAERPLSVAEIRQCASRDLPVLGRATVYRCLRRLRDQGRLSTVELPGLPPRYELAEREHHHHFLCLRCGRTFDMPGCPGDLRELAPEGFRVQEHFILLKGLCGECAKEAS